MIRLRYALIILSVIVTEIVSDINECQEIDTIDENELENLLSTNVCLNPEKIYLSDHLCNFENLNTIRVAVRVMFSNITYRDVYWDFAIERNFKSSCDKFYDFEKTGVEYNWLWQGDSVAMYLPYYEINNTDFCLKLVKSEELDMYIVKPHLCGVRKNVINIYIRGVSVLFMVISICIYLFCYLPRYNSVHNKSCTSYIICKAIHFSLRSVDELTLHLGILVPSGSCVLISIFGYYFIVATYLWLLVINFNIWKSFITYETTWQGNFKKFNKFVWSAAFGFFIFIACTDLIYTHDNYVWSVKLDLLSCWVNTRHWMAIVFLHGPIVLLILFNIILSILTGRHIYKEKRNVANQWSSSYIQNQIKNKANFMFFFQLFLFTGVFSIFEKLYNIFVILRIIDYESLDCVEPFICLQGVLLCLLTVLRKDVWSSLRERIRGSNSSENETQSTYIENK